MKQQWRILATAIMFLTRIPVGRSGSGEPEDLAASTLYFPLVGLLIGALVSLVFLVTNLFWNSDIAVVLCLLSAILLTGGFHEDGVADVADSAGVWTKEQKLDVMRDSRVGTYGALALMMVVLLKFVSLSSIAGQVNTTANQLQSIDNIHSQWTIAATLILAHVLGRWSTLPLIRFTPYARELSSNKVIAQGVTNRRLLVSSLMTLGVTTVCCLFLGSSTLYILIGVAIAIVLSRRWFIRSIGGITGDCLGAANQLVEVLVYLMVAGMLA